MMLLCHVGPRGWSDELWPDVASLARALFPFLRYLSGLLCFARRLPSLNHNFRPIKDSKFSPFKTPERLPQVCLKLALNKSWRNLHLLFILFRALIPLAPAPTACVYRARILHNS